MLVVVTMLLLLLVVVVAMRLCEVCDTQSCRFLCVASGEDISSRLCGIRAWLLLIDDYQESFKGLYNGGMG